MSRNHRSQTWSISCQLSLISSKQTRVVDSSIRSNHSSSRVSYRSSKHIPWWNIRCGHCKNTNCSSCTLSRLVTLDAYYWHSYCGISCDRKSWRRHSFNIKFACWSNLNENECLPNLIIRWADFNVCQGTLIYRTVCNSEWILICSPRCAVLLQPTNTLVSLTYIVSRCVV